MNATDAQVWRVCSYLHAVDGKFTGVLRPCKGCPRVAMIQGRLMQTGCYFIALQIVRTVETGDPQKGEENED